MRIITVDNGNTNPHVGIFEDGNLTNIIPLQSFIPMENDFIIASDVGSPLQFKLSIDLKSMRHTKNIPLFLGMPVHYSETLGDDRLICAHFIFQKIRNISDRFLIIDAGTFMTADLVTSEGFQGGWIFPGIMTFLASYSRGVLLPVLENKIGHSTELPHSTEEAILGSKEIYLGSILKSIVNLTMPSRIYITGGAGLMIERKIEELNLKVPLERDPHLIHSSLFSIGQSLHPKV